MSKIDELLSKMQKPDDIQKRMESPEGQVFKVELENYGKQIAKLEYDLKLAQLRQQWKLTRYKEYLGYQITDEEKDNASAIEEWLLSRGEI